MQSVYVTIQMLFLIVNLYHQDAKFIKPVSREALTCRLYCAAVYKSLDELWTYLNYHDKALQIGNLGVIWGDWDSYKHSYPPCQGIVQLVHCHCYPANDHSISIVIACIETWIIQSFRWEKLV